MRRIIMTTLTLSLLISILFFPVTAWAANVPVISAASMDGEAGNTVTVPIFLSNNTGFTNLTLVVEYSTILTLNEVKDSDLLSGAMHTTIYDSPYYLTWENDTDTENFTANGTLVELVFEIAEGAVSGTYPITISAPEDGILDCNGNEVTCSLVDGAVIILEEECEHEWGAWAKSSNSKHKRTCNLCAESEYAKHDWNDGEITDEPTQDETGLLTYTCSVCSGTKVEIIPALPSDTKHESCTYDQQKIDSIYLKTAATCSSYAEYYYSCTCGEYGEETFFDQNGGYGDHPYINIWAYDKNNHWHVTDCIHTDVIADLSPHEYTDTSDMYCDVCGYTKTTGPDAYMVLCIAEDMNQGLIQINDGDVTDFDLCNILPGTKVTISAIPAEGYRFVEWVRISLDGSETVVSNDPVYVVAPEDGDLFVAYFASEKYAVELIASTPNSAVVQATNKQLSSEDSMLVLAAYDEKGQVIQVSSIKKVWAPEQTVVLSVNCNSNQEIKIVRVFLLDAENYAPLQKAWEKKLIAVY